MRVAHLIRSSDLALARRLEAAEAANGFAMAPSFAGGCAEPHLGGCAFFAGPGSPISHAVGIGMAGPYTEAEFDSLEAFFASRNSACVIDLCPMCDLSALEQVQRRGYRIAEFNNVMVRPLTYADRWLLSPGVERTLDEPLWNRLVASGFSGQPDPPAELLSIMGRVTGFGEMSLLRIGGEAVGGAAHSIRQQVALLYGDATLPGARGKGGQTALIAARLSRAAEAGCDLAMACVLPGSGSHRNYERAGFRLAYMRVNVIREFD